MDSIFAGSYQHLETEVRFKITKEIFDRLVSRDEPSAELELTINVIDQGKGSKFQNIRRIEFRDGKSCGNTYSRKTPLYSESFICGGHKAKLYVSSEETIDVFAVSDAAFIRAKVRVMIPRGVWRVDLTAVMQARFVDVKDKLAGIRDELFGQLRGPRDVVKLTDPRLEYEAEIEFMSGDDPRPHLPAIRAICDELFAGDASNILVDCARVLGKRVPHPSIKQLGNQVTAVTRATWGEIYPPRGWFASIKYDGQRAFFRVSGTRAWIITHEIIELKVEDSPLGDILCDGEWMPELSTMFLFDTMQCGDVVTEQPFHQRRVYIPSIVGSLKLDGTITIAAKPFIELDDKWEDALRTMWEGSTLPSDGIIFTERDGSYSECRSLKWKPVEHNSIDFLAVKCARGLLGTEPYLPRDGYTLYILFCGISESARRGYGLTLIPKYEEMVTADGSYFPIQFSPSVQPRAHMWYVADSAGIDPDGKIVELRWVDGAWSYMRERTDRKSERGYFGNDFRIAETTFLNYIDVVKFDDLIHPPSTYFASDASTEYKVANALKRIVIGGILRKYFTAEDYLIDTMSGRGADMFRYGEIDVKRLLMMEIDAAAVAEAIRRKLTPRHGSTGALKISAAVADMRTGSADLVKIAAEYGFEEAACSVVCNFALHYMCSSIETVGNFLEFVSLMTRPKGHFMFTVMDGARVHKALTDLAEGETKVWMDGTNVKYAIGKRYTGRLASWGQTIAVKLPFTPEMREEPLANVGAIVQLAEKMGFKLVVNKSFGDFIAADSRMSAIDREYVSLHSIVVLQKKNGK